MRENNTILIFIGVIIIISILALCFIIPTMMHENNTSENDTPLNITLNEKMWI